MNKFIKFLANEFLWLLATLLLALPLALLFLWLLGFTTERVNLEEKEKDYLLTLYLIGYCLSVAGIYLVRMIRGALKIVSEAKLPE